MQMQSHWRCPRFQVKAYHWQQNKEHGQCFLQLELIWFGLLQTTHNLQSSFVTLLDITNTLHVLLLVHVLHALTVMCIYTVAWFNNSIWVTLLSLCLAAELSFVLLTNTIQQNVSFMSVSFFHDAAIWKITGPHWCFNENASAFTKKC